MLSFKRRQELDQRDWPTRSEIQEKARDLLGKSVILHYVDNTRCVGYIVDVGYFSGDIEVMWNGAVKTVPSRYLKDIEDRRV